MINNNESANYLDSIPFSLLSLLRVFGILISNSLALVILDKKLEEGAVSILVSKFDKTSLNKVSREYETCSTVAGNR